MLVNIFRSWILPVPSVWGPQLAAAFIPHFACAGKLINHRLIPLAWGTAQPRLADGLQVPPEISAPLRLCASAFW